MGLDMYLQKAKRIENVTPRQLNCINEYFIYLGRPVDYLHLTMESWCGIDISEVDMLLVEKYRSEYVEKYYSLDDEKKYPHKSIIDSIADWRKANHIHKWFVDNVQDGVDDCGMYEVTKEQLQELLVTCKEVLNGTVNVARELLPTTSGFFFGGTDYDQWYFEDIKYTIKIICDVLNTTDFEHEIVMYSSSW